MRLTLSHVVGALRIGEISPGNDREPESGERVVWPLGLAPALLELGRRVISAVLQCSDTAWADAPPMSNEVASTVVPANEVVR